MSTDRLYDMMMKKALRLARRAEGETSPNPMVGAVIFRGDRVIATGYHKKAGGPHAEIIALRKAGAEARGASIAVTLEPCCHVGRTGPCTDALISAGISEVIYAVQDPNKKVKGRGRRQLIDRGIRVVDGVCREEASKLNEVYFTFTKTGRPFVTLKMAQTLDGRIATRSGDSQWITSPESRKLVHRLRATYDAVAVGSGTVLADNPKLTVRHLKGKNPYRIIVSSASRLPKSLHMFRENSDHKTVVATTKAHAGDRTFEGIETWSIRKNNNRLDLGHLLDVAAAAGITSVLFEGGVTLATALLKSRLVDKLYLFTAPKILGDGKPTFGNLGIARINKAIRFRDSSVVASGPDSLFTGYPEW